MGIFNQTVVTLDNLTKIANVSDDPAKLFCNVNEVIYGGTLFYILMWVALFILIVVIYSKADQLLNSIMYAGAIVTVVSLMLRLVSSVCTVPIINDFQWLSFGILTTLVALVAYFTND